MGIIIILNTKWSPEEAEEGKEFMDPVYPTGPL